MPIPNTRIVIKGKPVEEGRYETARRDRAEAQRLAELAARRLELTAEESEAFERDLRRFSNGV